MPRLAIEPLVNRLVCSDCEPVLLGLPNECIDLIYIDPPFSTGKTRAAAAGHRYEDRTASGLDGYIPWLVTRLTQMHRVLAKKGSLFVHLDWRAVHYIKVELDRIFGRDQFVNELIWCYSIGGKSRRSFAKKHDTILWFAKGPEYAFYPDAVRIARKTGSHMRIETDESGQEVQVKRDRKSGKLYRYPVGAGKIPEDYWTDIETLNREARERVGWPTQKPEALLKRIILATTRPSDLVADFFCGSGTTAVVAERLGRRYLAVDSAADAVSLVSERLAKSREPAKPRNPAQLSLRTCGA